MTQPSKEEIMRVMDAALKDTLLTTEELKVLRYARFLLDSLPTEPRVVITHISGGKDDVTIPAFYKRRDGSTLRTKEKP